MISKSKKKEKRLVGCYAFTRSLASCMSKASMGKQIIMWCLILYTTATGQNTTEQRKECVDGGRHMLMLSASIVRLPVDFQFLLLEELRWFFLLMVELFLYYFISLQFGGMRLNMNFVLLYRNQDFKLQLQLRFRCTFVYHGRWLTNIVNAITLQKL